ncbi:MAG: ribosome maturation factor [Haliscomenobacteraceae bacterium CHB4]|nr:Ribosome maturation factor RimP [Saprospiraceae bacterium]MCE7926696.1 ribosome maturation factor [Haliscomenobacteraceae bacterium CHB4]
MDITERIAQLLEEKYAGDEAFADCFTVDIELKPGQKLCVFADSDSGMTFEKCQKLSRYLESYLDANNWLGDKYLLEVSSPGIGRPLKFLRQYRNNTGRTVEVTLKDKTRQTGLLKSADENQVVLLQKVVERENNKKKEVEKETAIPFEQIEKTVVKIVF